MSSNDGVSCKTTSGRSSAFSRLLSCFYLAPGRSGISVGIVDY